MEDPISINTENSSNFPVVYRGTLSGHWEEFGAEEGAHAAFFNIKSGNDIAGEALESASKVDRERQDIPGKNAVHPSPLVELTKDDLTALVQFNEPPFNGFTEMGGQETNAVELLSKVVEGASVPITQTLSEDKRGEIKLGLIRYTTEAKGPCIFYNPAENAILVDQEYLAAKSKMNLNDNIEDNSDVDEEATIEYFKQDHERRAMLWKMKLAKSKNPTQYKVLQSIWNKIK